MEGIEVGATLSAGKTSHSPGDAAVVAAVVAGTRCYRTTGASRHASSAGRAWCPTDRRACADPQDADAVADAKMAACRTAGNGADWSKSASRRWCVSTTSEES